MNSDKSFETKCPECGRMLDGSKRLYYAGVIPSPKDFIVCIYCISICQYQDNLSLKLVTDKELVIHGPKIVSTMTTIQSAIMYKNELLNERSMRSTINNEYANKN